MSLNLQDACFHILFLHLQKRSAFGNGFYALVVCSAPFELTLSPQVFTRVMVVAITHLRSSGTPIFAYLDDWLIKVGSPEAESPHLQSSIALLFGLGSSKNETKFHPMPSQRLQYLRSVLDTTLLHAFPPPPRIADILEMVPSFPHNARFTVLMGL